MRIRPLEVEALGLLEKHSMKESLAQSSSATPVLVQTQLCEVALPTTTRVVHFDDSQADRLSLSDASVAVGDQEEP